ncbi:MAG: DUF3426 domain-containing protein [Candidatus Accumulibacter sp.]|jgi:predicted Zn finger-like uncharacterized protein|nr:DUF3426 domain-containing protein [Accumulibacter sp.]
MKTRCPNCQTVFRITSEQLATRAGKVRCGHCRKVFNAVDELLEKPPAPAVAPLSTPDTTVDAHVAPKSATDDDEVYAKPEIPEKLELPHSFRNSEPETVENEKIYPYGAPFDSIVPDADLATELILPRETSEIPGYSKWAEGGMAPPLDIAAENPLYWPFRLVAVILLLALAGQAVFHFRSELAVSMPGLRPALEVFSLAVDGPLPLPRNAELIGIETSDLQTDMARNRLLVLNTTLRNKAPYGQAYPSLELSLTDTQDTVIARRIFSPQDYLPEKAAGIPFFPANADLAVRLWIEAVDLSAAGYRLFVYYP